MPSGRVSASVASEAWEGRKLAAMEMREAQSSPERRRMAAL